MAPSAAGRIRAGRRGRHQRAAVGAGGRIGEARHDPARRGGAVPALTHGVGQRDQIVFVGVRGQRPGVAHQFPAARRGDPAGVADTQIPRMRFGDDRQRTDHRRGIGIDERERRHRIVGAPGPAAATGNIHAREVIVRECRNGEGHAQPRARRSPTVTIIGVAERNQWRSRRGRDIRGPLLPPTVPGWRSRAERFDMAVLEAYEPIERRWQDRVSALDVAVDEIPRIAPKDPESVQWPPEVIADGPIALARLIPAGVDVRGNATRARIVLFRRPIERRAKDSEELAELLHDVLVAQVATYLGVEPSVIDPTIDDE